MKYLLTATLFLSPFWAYCARFSVSGVNANSGYIDTTEWDSDIATGSHKIVPQTETIVASGTYYRDFSASMDYLSTLDELKTKLKKLLITNTVKHVAEAPKTNYFLGSEFRSFTRCLLFLVFIAVSIGAALCLIDFTLNYIAFPFPIILNTVKETFVLIKETSEDIVSNKIKCFGKKVKEFLDSHFGGKK